jgi:hypothetical protein
MLVFAQNQTQYWARELKFHIITEKENLIAHLSMKINLGYLPIVEVSEFNSDFETLPPNSLIALLNTDEKYDSKLNAAILNSKVFKAIIRQYKVPKADNRGIFKALLIGLLESLKILSFVTPKRFVGWSIEGLGMAKRQSRMVNEIINSGKTIINVPLGYTDFFAETFLEKLKRTESMESMEVLRIESLLEIAVQRNFASKIKKNKFVFIGQLGHIVRQYAIEALSKFDLKVVVVREGYGGVSNDENRKLRIGEEYVEGLMESCVSVCPPGNISGNSYRIMESLICGAYPAVMSSVLCDPLFESPVIEVLPGRKPHTWYRYLKKLEKVSEAKLQLSVLENLHKFRDEIKVAKLEIENLQARN